MDSMIVFDLSHVHGAESINGFSRGCCMASCNLKRGHAETIRQHAALLGYCRGDATEAACGWLRVHLSDAAPAPVDFLASGETR